MRQLRMENDSDIIHVLRTSVLTYSLYMIFYPTNCLSKPELRTWQNRVDTSDVFVKVAKTDYFYKPGRFSYTFCNTRVPVNWGKPDWVNF